MEYLSIVNTPFNHLNIIYCLTQIIVRYNVIQINILSNIKINLKILLKFI